MNIDYILFLNKNIILKNFDPKKKKKKKTKGIKIKKS